MTEISISRGTPSQSVFDRANVIFATLLCYLCGVTHAPLLVATALLAPIEAYAQAPALQNPLLPAGADPWVTFRSGFYYYMNTTGSNLTIWRTRNMADLAQGEKKIVW